MEPSDNISPYSRKPYRKYVSPRDTFKYKRLHLGDDAPPQGSRTCELLDPTLCGVQTRSHYDVLEALRDYASWVALGEFEPQNSEGETYG